VRPVLVVVLRVGVNHALKVAAAGDEYAVEAVGAEGPHPAFGVGVRVRGPDGCADYSDAFGSEDFIEGVAELRVAVVDEKPERWSSQAAW
jgi:hypothetical protein